MISVARTSGPPGAAWTPLLTVLGFGSAPPRTLSDRGLDKPSAEN